MKLFFVLLLAVIAGCASEPVSYNPNVAAQMAYQRCKLNLENTVPPDRWGFPLDYSYCDRFRPK